MNEKHRIVEKDLAEAGARPMWDGDDAVGWHDSKARRQIRAWWLPRPGDHTRKGELVVTIADLEHGGIDLMHAVDDGSTIGKLLDHIRRSRNGEKSLHDEARQVLEAFDRVDWDRIVKRAEGEVQQIAPVPAEGAAENLENLLDLVTLLGASNRLREIVTGGED